MPDDVLVVGAGPTGLTAAVLLADQGQTVRIVDKRTAPSPHSKAFGVNARTLALHEATGLTDRLLAAGIRMTAINAWRRDRRMFRIDLTTARHRYPFMLVHSQARTEALLRELLAERGVKIEHGVELTEVHPGADATSVTLSHGERGSEIATPSIVLGADSAASTVRRSLNIEFVGSSFDEPWILYDVELETPLDPGEAHVFLLEDGGMFAVRLQDQTWRIIGNVADLLDRLPAGTQHGAITWSSDFGIASKVASQMQVGKVALAGDAAHIHSGLGARGMNLGIEDAFTFAHLLARGQLQRYDALRRPVVADVVRQTARVTEIPRGRRPHAKVARRLAPFLAPMIPIVQRRVAEWVLGLDHDLGWNPPQPRTRESD